MAYYINNVAAADQYSDALTLGPFFDARSVLVTVANNPALMQFATGKLGSWEWGTEREFFSIPQSFKVGNVIGVRFRNANTGQVARILATLTGDAGPQFESGMPFTGFLSASGQVSAIGAITGQVNSTGSIAAGTGFTVTKGGAGIYTINFPPGTFAATPTVTVTPRLSNNAAFVATTFAEGAGSVSVAVALDQGGSVGVLTDQNFQFIALPTQ